MTATYRRGVDLVLALILLAVGPGKAAAQLTVRGEVYDSASRQSPIQNAEITLVGHGATLSNEAGAFAFRQVPRGTYEIRVRALGYKDLKVSLTLVRDTALELPMASDPIGLAPIDVKLGRFDFDGEVRDARGKDAGVSGAEVTSDQGHEERTNLFGRFDLDDTFDGPLLHLTIRAFRYLPLDTTFVPAGKKRFPFDLTVDPLMDRIIGEYVGRLDVRAARNLHNRYRMPMNRQDLASLRANTTLREVLERRYSLRTMRSIGCMFLDEREYIFVSDEHRNSVFEGTFVNDVERIELLDFPAAGSMLRVYTRTYFQSHVGSTAKLNPPMMVATPMGILCR